MQIIISPAKSLDFETQVPVQTKSDYRLTKESVTIANELKKKKPEDLATLMKISLGLWCNCGGGLGGTSSPILEWCPSR